MVSHSAKDGIDDLYEFHGDTPDDVLMAAKVESNSRHRGNGFTFAERTVALTSAAVTSQSTDDIIITTCRRKIMSHHDFRHWDH